MVEILPFEKVFESEVIRFFLNLDDLSLLRMNHFGQLNDINRAHSAYKKLQGNAWTFDKEYWPWFAKLQNLIVGMVFLKENRNPKVRTLGIIIMDVFQGQGIGDKLMVKAINEGKKLGLKKIWLQVYANNSHAITLYKKFGFVQEGYFKAQEYDGDTPLDVISMGLFL